MNNRIQVRKQPEREKKICRIARFNGYAGDAPENALSLGHAEYACNVRLQDGRVTAAFGLRQAAAGETLLPTLAGEGTTIRNVGFFNRYEYETDSYRPHVLYHGADGYLYSCEIGDDEYFRLGATPIGEVEFLNYKADSGDWILAFDESGQAVAFNGSFVTVFDVPHLKGVSLYKGRVFGVERADGSALRCGAVGSLNEWYDEEEGAYAVYFNDGDGGALQRTLVCGENLYVFRDYSVWKFTGYVDLNDYVASKVFSSGGRIYANTAAVIGDSVYFTTEDGFYTLKGSEVIKRFPAAFTLVEDASQAWGAGYGGKYYLAAKFRTEGTPIADEATCVGNNGILALDPETGGTELLRGAGAERLLPVSVNGRKYLYVQNPSGGARATYLGMLSGDGKIYGTPAEKRWQSPTLPLGGLRETHRVTKLFIRTPHALTVRVTVGEETVERMLAGSGKVQTVPIGKYGDRVRVSVSGTDPAFRWDGFEIEYETVDRREYGAN